MLQAGCDYANNRWIYCIKFLRLPRFLTMEENPDDLAIELSLGLDLENLQPPTLWDFVTGNVDRIRDLAIAQMELLLLVMSITAVIGIGLGLLVWKRQKLSEALTNTFAAILTIPSLALLILMISPFGLGWLPTVISLLLYAQLPVLRNTIVGMRSVDSAILESASAMGMPAWKVLFRIQFPLAWPVIVAGLRVSSMLIFGISAIAAYVGGPGFGEMMFAGLASLGAFNSMNQTIVGALGITILALAFDAMFVFIRRITTSRGIRV